MFGSTRDYRSALNVAAYGALPVLLAGGLLLLPAMAIVGVVALCHTMFLYWVGARCVLHVAAGDLSEFIGISSLLLAARLGPGGRRGERRRTDLTRECSGAARQRYFGALPQSSVRRRSRPQPVR